MIKAAVLGATGMVGQIFIHLLQQHPWIKVTVVAASEKSSGLSYDKAAKWRLPYSIPEDAAQLEVVDASPKAVKDVDVVFSALPAEAAAKIEEDFAKEGYVVVSNASAHRLEPDVPLLNPEVNDDHVSLIEEQRKRRNWSGAIITNPNCSTAILTLPLKPIHNVFGINRVIVSTMQALSGAGYPGVQSLDIIDNIIPFIKNEEEKIQSETLKILGSPSRRADFKVSASCHRVSTLDGHMEAVFAELKREVDPEVVADTLNEFSGEPQKLKLPSAPLRPIVVRCEEDRPQPRLDRMEGNGMSVVVGRLRRDEGIGGIKFVVMGHNTIRGGAGCAILNAEYLKTIKYI
jgi:aspartate-semialdehyde dehydrogenase